MSHTIALLGATGRVGGATVEACLARGMAVRALIRGDLTRLPPRDGLTVLGGDVLDPDDVTALLEGADAVVTTLGTPPWQLSTITAPAVEVLLSCMGRQGVRRLIAVSSLGVGDSRDQVPFLLGLIGGLPLPYVRDKCAFESAVRQSDTRWTLVRPWFLYDGPAEGYEAVERLQGSPRSLAFVDVAAFIVDELQNGAFVGKAVTLSGCPWSDASDRLAP